VSSRHDLLRCDVVADGVFLLLAAGIVTAGVSPTGTTSGDSALRWGADFPQWPI
jgi:hypothetical protein